MRDGSLGKVMDEATTTAREFAEATRETALRAGDHAREQAGVVLVRARDLASGTAETFQAWTSGVHGAMRARRLYVLGVAIGAGFLLGRVLRRR